MFPTMIGTVVIAGIVGYLSEKDRVYPQRDPAIHHYLRGRRVRLLFCAADVRLRLLLTGGERDCIVDRGTGDRPVSLAEMTEGGPAPTGRWPAPRSI